MAKNIIPYEDNTNEIIRADLLKYGFINKRNKLRKNKTNASAAKRQKQALKILEDELSNLESGLNVARNKKYVKEDEQYITKFSDFNREIQNNKDEWNEQKLIETSLDEEIAHMENKVEKAEMKIKKAQTDGTKMNFLLKNKNNEYNRLLHEQNQLKTQIESLQKLWQQKQHVYDTFMNKLKKGKQLVSELSEQVLRTLKSRNDVKERLDLTLKISKSQIADQKLNLIFAGRQMREQSKAYEFLLIKDEKTRENKIPEKSPDDDQLSGVVEAFEQHEENSEAKAFIHYLINISDELDLETITEEIVKMNIDNKSMFRFLAAMELHLRDVENAIKRLKAMGDDAGLCEARATHAERYANVRREYKEGSAKLRGAQRALRLTAAEWQRTFRVLDEVCGVIGVDRSPVPAAHDDDSHRRPPCPADVISYFRTVEKRLNDVLYRLFWHQHVYGAGAAAKADVKTMVTTDDDSMSTESEQDDAFVARDLDGDRNRRVKMCAFVDPTIVPFDAELLAAGHVTSICPFCLAQHYKGNINQELPNYRKVLMDKGKESTTITCLCRSEQISLKEAEYDYLNKFIHRIENCPVYSRKKYRKD